MRPTRQVHMNPITEPSLVVDRLDWETLSVWPHLDMCPWTWKCNDHGFLRGKYVVDYDIMKVQGMVALHDCGPEDGGLRVLPGSLCIWRSELVHDTFPCTSSRGRLIQYMKMASGEDETVKQWYP
eukprot:gene29358-36400_t